MLIDSNILVYALNESSHKYSAARRFLTDNQDDLVITQQNIFETIRILTHSKYQRPLTPSQAITALSKITEFATVIHPTSETVDIAFALIQKHNVTGSEVFDAYLVATALSHNFTSIATDNTKHLAKYSEIKV